MEYNMDYGNHSYDIMYITLKYNRKILYDISRFPKWLIYHYTIWCFLDYFCSRFCYYVLVVFQVHWIMVKE